jgi:hypothetical protein
LNFHEAGDGVVRIAAAILPSSGQKVSRETVRRILRRVSQVAA